MKVKYLGSNAYNPKVGKLVRGLELEVSNEIANQLLRNRNNWAVVGMVERNKAKESSGGNRESNREENNRGEENRTTQGENKKEEHKMGKEKVAQVERNNLRGGEK